MENHFISESTLKKQSYWQINIVNGLRKSRNFLRNESRTKLKKYLDNQVLHETLYQLRIVEN